MQTHNIQSDNDDTKCLIPAKCKCRDSFVGPNHFDIKPEDEADYYNAYADEADYMEYDFEIIYMTLNDWVDSRVYPKK